MGKFLSSIKEGIEDFDFSDVTDSIASKAADKMSDVAVDKKVNFATGVKTKKKEGKVKRIIRNIAFWIIIISLVLYMIIDVWIQVENHQMQTAMETIQTENTEMDYGDLSQQSVEIPVGSDHTEDENVVGDAPLEISGLYTGEGMADGKYPIVVELELTETYVNGEPIVNIKGKYAYKLTLRKYGKGDASWFYLKGRLNESAAEVDMTSWKYDSEDPLETFRLSVENMYSQEMDMKGTFTNLDSNKIHTVSFSCRNNQW